MQVRVIKLRENGKRLSKDSLKPPLDGSLELINYRTAGRGYALASLTNFTEHGKLETLARLYEPKLTGLQGNTIRLEGLEKTNDGQILLQCWKCLVVS